MYYRGKVGRAVFKRPEFNNCFCKGKMLGENFPHFLIHGEGIRNVK